MSTSVVYDEVRQLWVASTPEEQVRQRLIGKMLHQLQYPRELLVVEKSLMELCPGSTPPARRVDVVSFAKNPQGLLVPLLVVECKESGQDSQEALSQVLGYNHFLQAIYVGVVCGSEEQMGYSHEGRMHFIPYIPPYKDLLDAIGYR